ncbi:MAG TPA: TolC family protein [Draconibacterium sp.]|jgi:outer membrane protein|nr:TolC family protein [Draconibacterium sp.]
MKHLFILILAVVFMIVGSTANAQNVWSLQKCIDYALENNIQIKQQQLNTQFYENQVSQAKANRLPNLNVQFGNDNSFGRSLTYLNTYENVNSSSITGGAGTSFTIFDGFALSNTIDKQELDFQATLKDMQKAKDDIMLNIAGMYLEILFAEELELVSEAQLDVTKQQINRTQQLVDAGSLAKGALLEIEAQLAREELQLVNDRNRVQLSYLSLFQMLELPIAESFKIEKPSLPEIKANYSMANSIDVFNNALNVRPEIQAAQLRVKSAEKDLEIAKGNHYPSLSFNANYYNLYNNKYTDRNGEDIAFSDQLKNNGRSSLGLTLAIPIFNRFQVKYGISNATLQISDFQYRLQTASNTLRKEIEQAYTNAIASLNRYMSSEKAVESMEEAFRYVEEKFNVGMVNSVDYNLQKNQLTVAQSQLLQAKYEYIFRTKILDFYNGIPIEL